MQRSRSVVFNIEANGLNPDKIWVVTCIDADTGEEYVFRRPDLHPIPFVRFWSNVTTGIGHNCIVYDNPVLVRLLNGYVPPPAIIDTLVISRLLEYARAGKHSLKAWAGTLGLEKGIQPPWDAYSEALVDHSLENIRVTLAVYKTFLPYLNSPRWKGPIDTEMKVQTYLSEMHQNGFYLDVDNVEKLRYNILEEVNTLDGRISDGFPPKARFLREVHPRITKFGTLNRSDFRFLGKGPDLTAFNGGPFSLIEFEPFNPGSPAQIVERLNEAGWKPTEKTKGHLAAIRARDKPAIEKFATTGWTISETNLNTLPNTAPDACRFLALRIMLASRARMLKTWLDAYNPKTHRVHGTVNGIGAWTHRCSHVNPNTGNIPVPQPVKNKSYLQRRARAIDYRLRKYWRAAPGAFLVGVDAEGIQLRVLAHYINDPRFTYAVVSGKKEDKTDPHSLNKVALGSPCKSREDAKTFIYAWLLGAGHDKVSQILTCSYTEAKQADADFIEFYPGLADVKKGVIPRDARRGYFEGFDGRYVAIVGDDQSSREHFALAGYLQNGEKIVMAKAMTIWYPRLTKERIPFELVNFVHDEWQTQVNADRQTAEYVASVQKDAIRQAGEDLQLLCPMSGSSDIGFTWSDTH